MKRWTPPSWHVTRCAYCRQRRAVNKDHVVPKLLRKGYEADGRIIRQDWDKAAIPSDFLGTVPCCFECNMRKGTRRLVPPSWAGKVDALNAFFGGTEWRVWRGDPKEEAFTKVHV